jgi:hypothetical protein
MLPTDTYRLDCYKTIPAGAMSFLPGTTITTSPVTNTLNHHHHMSSFLGREGYCVHGLLNPPQPNMPHVMRPCVNNIEIWLDQHKVTLQGLPPTIPSIPTAGRNCCASWTSSTTHPVSSAQALTPK